MSQNLCDAVKVVLKGAFLAINANIKNQERSLINNLTLPLKELEKEQQTDPKVSRREKIIRIRAEINEIENRK